MGGRGGMELRTQGSHLVRGVSRRIKDLIVAKADRPSRFECRSHQEGGGVSGGWLGGMGSACESK